MLRASSLAAVTSLVWSTRLKPSCTAQSRAICRTTTMSSPERTGRVSWRTTAIPRSFESVPANQIHSLFDVERRVHAVQRESQLDERDGHGRAHADDDG